MDSKELDKYNTAARICGQIYKEVVEKIRNGDLDVRSLCDYGTKRIVEECGRVYKTESIKGVAYPVSISVDGCVGGYYYEEGMSEYNNIRKDSVVKIELGVNIGGCIAMLAETIGEEGDEYIKTLGELQSIVLRTLVAGETNDEVRTCVEEVCVERDCFPVENCVSYQHVEGQPRTDESKYIVMNHQKYFNEDDELIVEEDVCFDIEEGDVYTVNLTIVPNNENDEHVYKERHSPHIYRINHYHYNLKLKSARDIYSRVRKSHDQGGFYMKEYESPRDKMGINECVMSGIMESVPVLYEKENVPVYTKKFTVVVMKDKCLKLKYAVPT